MLAALSISGDYVVGAYIDEELVGAGVAFRGDDHVHSHIVGVLPLDKVSVWVMRSSGIR
jgi:predicted GNAT superfamily acetyltransferase